MKEEKKMIELSYDELTEIAGGSWLSYAIGYIMGNMGRHAYENRNNPHYAVMYF